MISFRNLSGRRLRTRDEEIELMKHAEGTVCKDGTKFELITLQYHLRGDADIPVRGFQDTMITLNRQGNVEVSHGDPGRGCIRFVRDRFNNRIANLAATPHNVFMLARDFRTTRWKITSEKWLKVIEAQHNEWWNALPQREKDAILKFEAESKKTIFDVPINYGQKDQSALPTETLMKEAGQKDEALRKVQEENAELRKAIAELQAGAAPKEDLPPQPVLATPAPEAAPSGNMSYDDAINLGFNDLKKMVRAIPGIPQDIKDNRKALLAKYKDYLKTLEAVTA